jgi:hypothetical protein
MGSSYIHNPRGKSQLWYRIIIRTATLRRGLSPTLTCPAVGLVLVSKSNQSYNEYRAEQSNALSARSQMICVQSLYACSYKIAFVVAINDMGRPHRVDIILLFRFSIFI